MDIEKQAVFRGLYDIILTYFQCFYTFYIFRFHFLENQPFISLIIFVSSEDTLIQTRIGVGRQLTLNKGPIGITYDTVPDIEYIAMWKTHWTLIHP